MNFEFAVYPNPAASVLNIELKNLKDQIHYIQMYNAVGQLVYYSKINQSGSAKLMIDVHDMASGIYSIKVGSRIKKVVID